MLQLCGGSAEKRPAGCGQDDFVEPVPLRGLHALKNRRVLGVHGQDFNAPAPRSLCDEVARANEGLLVCKRDIVPGLNGRHGGQQADHAHNRGRDNIGGRQRRGFD